MSSLSLAEVEHVALLSRLRLTPEEKERLTRDLNVILAQFEILQRLDTTDVAPTPHPLPMQNVLREDSVGASLDRHKFLTQAPDAREEFFVVPRVVET